MQSRPFYERNYSWVWLVHPSRITIVSHGKCVPFELYGLCNWLRAAASPKVTKEREQFLNMWILIPVLYRIILHISRFVLRYLRHPYNLFATTFCFCFYCHAFSFSIVSIHFFIQHSFFVTMQYRIAIHLAWVHFALWKDKIIAINSNSCCSFNQICTAFFFSIFFGVSDENSLPSICYAHWFWVYFSTVDIFSYFVRFYVTQYSLATHPNNARTQR